jgi:cyanate permease
MVVLGVLVLIVAVPLVAWLAVDAPERPAPAAAQITTLREAVRSRPFWLLTLAFGVNGWTLYFTLLHLPRIADELGAGAATGGGLLALAAAASAAAIVGAAPLVARFGKRRVVGGLFAWRAAVLVGTAVLVTRPGHLALVALLFGLASFPVIPLVMGLIGERFGTDVLGGVLGLVYVSHQLFAGLGVLSGGLLSFDAGLVLCAVALVTGIALLSRLDDFDLPQTNPMLKGRTACTSPRTAPSPSTASTSSTARPAIRPTRRCCSCTGCRRPRACSAT